MRKPSLLTWLIIAAVVIVIDQASKLWALSALASQDMAVCWGLNFALTQNAGAVFGILAKSSGWQRWFFTGFALVMMLVIFIWQSKLSKDDFLESISLAFVLGGGIGNVIDRVRLGYVIDFIDVYYDKWHWYTFNVADIFICVGAGLLLLIAVLEEKKPHRLFD